MSETQYYVDQHGQQYYLDQNGQPVYIDPIQPVQPAAPAQPAYTEAPITPAQAPPAPPITPQAPVQKEPALGQNFAPPEDYNAPISQNDAPPIGQNAPSQNGGPNTGMYADQYGAAVPAPKRSKLPLVMAVVGAIGAGGGGAYVYNNNYGGDLEAVKAGIPFIKASSQSAKVKPKDSGGKVFQNTNKHIYDRLGGGKSTSREQLRAKAESPEAATMRKAAEVRKKAQQHAKAPRKITGGEPKKVKTFVVLPDGRVIKPGSNQAPAKAVTSAPVKVTPTPIKKVAEAVTPVAGSPGGDQRLFVNKTNIGQGLRGSAPKRVEQVPSGNGKFKYKPRRVASADSAAMPAPAPSASNSISSGDYLLQLAARRSEEGAMEAFTKLKQQYSSILGSYISDIQRADLGAKGIYYRIRVGPIDSRSAAIDVCQQLKDAGGDCLIRQK